jgi:hypothetical protein
MRDDENNVKNNNDSHLFAGQFPALLRVNALGALPNLQVVGQA